jgi:hypothetical protein
MTDTAKTRILKAVTDQGHSESYGVLLHTAALLGPDVKDLEPESAEELSEWLGFSKGLRSALFCLAMYEKRTNPESAVLIVSEHLKQAFTLLNEANGGSGG